MMNKEQAIQYCERKIPNKLNKTYDCRDCYWSNHPSRCEIHGKYKENCYDYTNDIRHGNLVKEKILNDQDWCIENWHLLDRYDKNVYCIIYGEDEFPLNIIVKE